MLEKWTARKSMKIGQGNCRFLPLERNRHWDALATTKLESSFTEQDLRVVVNTRLNVSSQHSILTTKKG